MAIPIAIGSKELREKGAKIFFSQIWQIEQIYFCMIKNPRNLPNLREKYNYFKLIFLPVSAAL